MPAHRKLAMVAAIGVAPLLLTIVAAGPAGAHGATTSPVSRAAACGAEGGQNTRSDACRAAIAASSPTAVENWDTVRVANVGGRDRELIPDGRLCSAGISHFAGLDLPRPDWPVTELSPGADFTFTYRGTIPHKGTFRWYVTKDGYDPSQPLRWADLEAEPFLTATDPALESGSYAMAGQLPKGKSGRQLIYAIWQNSDTPDTYYSCSDVVFSDGAGEAPAPAAEETLAAAPEAAAGAAPAPAATGSGQSSVLPLAVGVVAVLAAAGGGFAFRRRRRGD